MVKGRFLASLAALALVLAACANDSDDSATAASDATGDSPAPAEERAIVESDDSADGASLTSTGLATGQVDVDPTERQVITTAFVTVHVDDVEQARDEIIDLVVAVDGIVTGEQTQLGENPFASITVRLPPRELRPMLNRLTTVGEVAGQSVESDDVTEVVVDLASRQATLAVSVDRLRGFLDEANTVTDITQLESELARREADLESIRAQLRTLEGRVALSTLTIDLTADAPPEPDDDATFVGAVKGGWRALTATGQVIALIFGALLVWIPVLIVLALLANYAVPRIRRLAKTRSTALPDPPSPPSAL